MLGLVSVESRLVTLPHKNPSPKFHETNTRGRGVALNVCGGNIVMETWLVGLAAVYLYKILVRRRVEAALKFESKFLRLG